MENKYYQPTIEELLIAIINKEPIYKSIKDEVQEIKFIGSIENTLYEFIKNNDVRYTYDFENNIIADRSVNIKVYLLKYLDKEDIEKVFGKNIIVTYYNSYTKKDYIYDDYYELEVQSGIVNQDKLRYRLRYDNDNNDLVIERSDWDLKFHQDFLFKGTIKNKSELKTLLKQLNII